MLQPDTELSKLILETTEVPRGIRVRFLGSEYGTRAALRAAIAGLREYGLSDDGAGKVEIVLAEVLNNIVEHAYCDQPDGIIDLTCHLGVDHVWTRIVDSGRMMPNAKPPTTQLPDMGTDILDLPEGGFGWFLIRQLTEELIYDRDDPLNLLSLKVSIVPDLVA